MIDCSLTPNSLLFKLQVNIVLAVLFFFPAPVSQSYTVFYSTGNVTGDKAKLSLLEGIGPLGLAGLVLFFLFFPVSEVVQLQYGFNTSFDFDFVPSIHMNHPH